MAKLKYDDVFVPNDQPVHTYVPRNSKKLEDDLRDHMGTKNIVISISGPSKTGKTVLFKQIVTEDDIIPITGVSIKSEADFWTSVFAWMGSQSASRGLHHRLLEERLMPVAKLKQGSYSRRQASRGAVRFRMFGTPAKQSRSLSTRLSKLFAKSAAAGL